MSTFWSQRIASTLAPSPSDTAAGPISCRQKPFSFPPPHPPSRIVLVHGWVWEHRSCPCGPQLLGNQMALKDSGPGRPECHPHSQTQTQVSGGDCSHHPPSVRLLLQAVALPPPPTLLISLQPLVLSSQGSRIHEPPCTHHSPSSLLPGAAAFPASSPFPAWELGAYSLTFSPSHPPSPWVLSCGAE